ncbi:DHH family phosphoesterase [Candidatus Woesearchaeota archaeon]|nr:DHH family phosphoesterase [Candidatus Woesearchaeota archaeon]
MAFTNEQIQELREELESSFRPLIFFDDDADGLSSFLLFYRFIKEGKGVILKTYPMLDDKFIRKVEEYHPDKIFILDIPKVSQDFIDNAKTKVVWLDHHQPAARKNVKYYNPLIKSTNNNTSPTSYWAYKVVEQDIWIAMAGCIGDWFIPDFKNEFIKEYPDLLSSRIKKPEDALFNSKIGLLAKIFNFIVKGKTSEAMTCVKILTRINDPYEILEQTSPQGRFIYKRFQKINTEYDELLKQVKVTNDKIILFIYSGNKMSFTSDLSNELLYRHQDKFVITGRTRSGEVKLSLRCGNRKVLPIVQKALKDVDGYGGGHEHACGACIKEKDFNKFIDNIEKQI